MKPPEFTVIVDTREPEESYTWDGVQTQRGTLLAGDYSLVGLEHLASVERKSFADFYGCLVTGTDRDTSPRLRFEDSLHRLAAIRYPLVVIEADMTRLCKPFTYVAAGGARRRSRVPPLVAQNSLLSWQARYRVPMLLCGDRARAAKMTLQHLLLAAELARGNPLVEDTKP